MNIILQYINMQMRYLKNIIINVYIFNYSFKYKFYLKTINLKLFSIFINIREMSRYIVDYLKISPALKYLFPKITHNDIDITGSLTIVNQAAWVFYKINKYMLENNVELTLTYNIDIGTHTIVFPNNVRINELNISSNDISLLLVMLSISYSLFESVSIEGTQYDDLDNLMRYLITNATKYNLSTDFITLLQRTISVINEEGHVMCPMISLNPCDIYEKILHLKRAISDNNTTAIYQYYQMLSSKDKQFGPRDRRTSRLNISVNSNVEDDDEVVDHNTIYSDIVNYYVAIPDVKKYLLGNVTFKDDTEDVDQNIAKIKMLIATYIRNVHIIAKDKETKHKVTLEVMLTMGICTMSRLVMNDVAIVQNNSYINSILSNIVERPTELYYDVTGHYYVQIGPFSMNITEIISKTIGDEDTKICDIFGGTNQDFKSDCNDLYALFIRGTTNKEEIRQRFNDLKSVPTNLNYDFTGQEAELKKSSYIAVAHSILKLLGLIPKINGNTETWFDGNYTISDNEIIRTLHLTHEAVPVETSDRLATVSDVNEKTLVDKKVDYIKLLMKFVGSITVRTNSNPVTVRPTQNIDRISSTTNVPQRSLMDTFPLAGLPVLPAILPGLGNSYPLAMHGGGKQQLQILYGGGKITDDINRILKPLEDTLRSIGVSQVIINQDKYNKIQSTIITMRRLTQELENVEKEITIMKIIIENKGNAVNKEDFEAEYARLESVHKDISSKLGTKINQISIVHDKLVRHLN